MPVNIEAVTTDAFQSGPQAVAAPVGCEVSVVIVSYNTAALTVRCLTHLHEDLAGRPAEVFVVDNGSTDGSVAAVRAGFPGVGVIESGRNAGFGAANNSAMARARGEFLLLLNSDAFVEPGCVAALVDCLRRRPAAGVVGPRLLNADGSLQRSCFRFVSPGRAWLENLWLSRLGGPASRIGDYSRWPHDVEADVDWVVGACMLVRRAAYEQVGGFDERFFMYAEETDWQRRIRSAGWGVAFCPAARVTHLGGASGEADRPARDGRFFESLDRYVAKHHGRAGVVGVRVAMVVGCSLRAALWGAVWCGGGRRRARAWGKVRLNAWLVGRQLFHWRPLAG